MGYSVNDMTDRYGKGYHSGERKFGDIPGGFHKDGHWENMAKWNDVAFDVYNLINHGSVLEIGCGRGSLTLALRNFGLDAKGIDISKWSIENPISPAVSPFIKYQAAQDIDPTERYDLIVAFDVIEHIPYDFYQGFFAKLQIISPLLLTTVPTQEPVHRFNSDKIAEHYVADTVGGWTNEFLSLGYTSAGPLSGKYHPLNGGNLDNYPFFLRSPRV